MRYVHEASLPAVDQVEFVVPMTSHARVHSVVAIGGRLTLVYDDISGIQVGRKFVGLEADQAIPGYAGAQTYVGTYHVHGIVRHLYMIEAY